MPLFEAWASLWFQKVPVLNHRAAILEPKGPISKKRGPNMDPILAKNGQIELWNCSFFMVLEPPGVPKASQNTHALIINVF